MGEKTGITWCDATFNPWWGCVKVSAGCTNCYAESQSKRYGWDIWGTLGRRRMFGDAHWNDPIAWYKKVLNSPHPRVPTKVFCGSMCDWAEDRDDLAAPRARLFTLIEDTSPWLTWLLLTKRPENILKFIPDLWRAQAPHNVWYGTTTENQEQADERIPLLLQVPARVRFLSAEPLLGPVDLNEWHQATHPGGFLSTGKIHWVITGGESGPKARPMDIEWVRDIQRQCKKAGVAFFHKQMGTVWAKAHGLPAHEHASNPDQWPEDIRVQEFPRTE